MLRTLLLFLLTVILAHAEKKVEVFAASLDTNGSVVSAKDDVVVLYDGMYISAESASFDRDAGVIELYGNVSALKGAEYYTMGDYLMLNTTDDIKQFRPFFFQEKSDELWISARSAKAVKKEYELHTGVVSSCDPQDPDWTLRFSSGYYDDEDQWMQLYNARLYAGSVPVFYFPYVAYPTDTTRRTGLLRPTFGLSSDEGFMYQQPIYIAESPQWDVELLPQVRVKRGKGLYSTLRFVDSPRSSGSLTVGGFREELDYQEAFQLKNNEHYGTQFRYQHNEFLKTWFDSNIQGSSGLYADITYLNDVDYLNLQESDSLDYATTSQVTSKVNMFLNQSENYYGMYSKYFIDMTKDSNSDTIQNLPTFQYHHALNTFFDDHFLYSFDYRVNNFYRETRKNGVQNELRVPLSLQFPLLDEYLTLTLSENLYASHLSFYGSDNPNNPNNSLISVPEPLYGYSPGTFGRDIQRAELNSNLVKDFDDFTHSVGLTVSYAHPGVEKRTGFYADYEKLFRDECQTDSLGPCEYNRVNENIEQANIEFTQYVFTDEEGEKLYHRLKQPLVYEEGYDRYGDLENELRYYFYKALNYYNNTFYNYDRNVVSKTQNTIGYNDTTFVFDLSHLYEDRLVDDTRIMTRYVTTGARYNYSSRWQYFAGYAYDIEASQTKNRYLGFLFSKRCWSAELRYVENIRPILGALGTASAVQDNIIYLTLNLRPLGGFEVDYKESNNE